MATLDLADTSLREHELTERGTENHSLEWGAPPLAPIGTNESRHPELVPRKPAVDAHEDDLLNGSEQNDFRNFPDQDKLSGSRRSFSLRQKLAAGTAMLAALGVCAYAYFHSTPRNDPTPPQSAQVSTAVEPAAASSVQTARNATGSFAEPAGSESASSKTETLPVAPVFPSEKLQPAEASQKTEPVEPPQKLEPAGASQKGEALGASQKVVSAASGTTSEARTSAAAAADVLFLQRPGVNIRSTPSKTGSAVGTAPKGTRFKVLNREADWVQVQNGRLKGWVNAQFLAPSQPR
jgi:cytoskeletal protein RodZ